MAAREPKRGGVVSCGVVWRFAIAKIEKTSYHERKEVKKETWYHNIKQVWWFSELTILHAYSLFVHA